jgi:hypothetical protein
MDRAGWEQQQECERERWMMTIEALNRCAAAGARPEDLNTLARECGIDPKHIKIGHEHAKAQ